MAFFDFDTVSSPWTTPEGMNALGDKTIGDFGEAGTPNDPPKKRADIPLNQLPQKTQDELSKKLSGIEPLTTELDKRIQSITIDASVEQHFIDATGEPPSAGLSNLELIILSHDYALINNAALDEDERIEGYPGSPLLVAFFVEKAMGKNVTAQSLQDDLSKFGVFRELKTCKLVELLAGHYIHNHIDWKPGFEPPRGSSSQPKSP